MCVCVCVSMRKLLDTQSRSLKGSHPFLEDLQSALVALPLPSPCYQLLSTTGLLTNPQVPCLVTLGIHSVHNADKLANQNQGYNEWALTQIALSHFNLH